MSTIVFGAEEECLLARFLLLGAGSLPSQADFGTPSAMSFGVGSGEIGFL